MELDSLEIVVQSNAPEAAAGIDELSDSLSDLKKAAKGGVGLAAVSSQLDKLKSTLAGITSLGRIQQVTTALRALSSVQKPVGLASALQVLRKIPKIAEQWKSQNWEQFPQQIQSVTDSIGQLAAAKDEAASSGAAPAGEIVADSAGQMRDAAKSFEELYTPILSLQKVLSGVAGIPKTLKDMGETSLGQLFGGLEASTTKVGKFTKGLIGAGGLVAGFSAARDYAAEFYYALNGEEGSVGSACASLVTGSVGAVVGGAMIGGPIGAVVGGCVALAGAFIGAQEAQAQLRLEMLRTDFYDINGVKIEEVRQSLQNYFNAMDFDRHAQWVQTIETATTKYQDAAYNYDIMWQTIANKPVFDASDIEGLGEAFQDLADAAMAVNDAKIDVLMESIASSIKNNITPGLNDQLGDLLGRLQEAQQLLGTKIANIQKQYNDVLAAIEENGGVATDPQKQKLQELREDLAFYTISEDYSAKQWETSLSDALKQGINAGDNAEQVKASVEALIGDRDEYLDNLKELYSQNSSTIAQLIKMGFVDESGNALFSQTDLDNLKKNYDAQYDSVVKQYNEVLDTIINEFYKRSVMASGQSYEMLYGEGSFLEGIYDFGKGIVGVFATDYVARSELAREQQALIDELKKYKLNGYN